MITPRHLTPADIAADLGIPKRRVAAMAAAGVFGPVVVVGPKCKRITREGYERYIKQHTQGGN